jgi:hypothetical protein
MINLTTGLHDTSHGADQESPAERLIKRRVGRAEIGRKPAAEPFDPVPFQVLEIFQNWMEPPLIGDALDCLSRNGGSDADTDL